MKKIGKWKVGLRYWSCYWWGLQEWRKMVAEYVWFARKSKLPLLHLTQPNLYLSFISDCAFLSCCCQRKHSHMRGRSPSHSPRYHVGSSIVAKAMILGTSISNQQKQAALLWLPIQPYCSSSPELKCHCHCHYKKNMTINFIVIPFFLWSIINITTLTTLLPSHHWWRLVLLSIHLPWKCCSNIKTITFIVLMDISLLMGDRYFSSAV